METYVIRNAQYITGEKIDIIIKNGFIHEITTARTGKGDKIYDCSDTYISSGWIDLHTHAFSKHHPYGDHIDEIGIKQGVTTVVDAGSCGAKQISELIAEAKQSKTNVFAFLNISQIGLERIDELSNLKWINQEKVIKAINDYPHFIVGLKARMSKSVVGTNGLRPLKIAHQIADQTSLPMMVHIGSKPPLIEEIVLHLQKNDIITHYLNNKANGFLNEKGIPKKQLVQALHDGILLDVGHGSASFSFSVAEMAKKHDIHFHTISTDIYRENRLHGPVFSLANTLTKFLYLGYSLHEVIRAVTETPAKILNRPELGNIQTNTLANLTLFTIEDKPNILIDSEGDRRNFNKKITVQGVVINGEFISYKT